MDFNYSEEHQAIRKMAADFAQNRLAPHAAQWDSEHIFPVDILREAAALGLAGMNAKEDIGGSHLSRLDSALVFEQLATGCISTSAYLSIHNMVTTVVDRYGSDYLRQSFGKRLTCMDLLASYCLTEPQSGSDAAALKTTAKRDGDDYVLNGAKSFISGGSVSDVYLCMVRTGDNSYKGISCVLVEKGTPGLSFGKLEHKMGWNSQPTTMVFFENCRVPVKNLVGEEGQGFKIALQALNGGRLNISACSLGGALACINACQRYLGERKQFDKPLNQMQALRFYFADMVTELHAARLMLYRAAQAVDEAHADAPLWCAMAKRLATDTAFQISDKAMQMHGGYGYLHDYPIERIFRDLRVHRILEGTNEIMREIIAKHTLDNDFTLE